MQVLHKVFWLPSADNLLIPFYHARNVYGTDAAQRASVSAVQRVQTASLEEQRPGRWVGKGHRRLLA